MKKTSRPTPDSWLLTPVSCSRLTPVSCSRPAFTLVEMLVAMALTIFVMVILSECFILGLETFSGLKTIGDMQEELRTATNQLRADLKENHFEGMRRLSDPVGSFTGDLNMLANVQVPAQKLTIPERIKEGFFAIGQGYPGSPPMKLNASLFPSPVEGQDDNIPSYRVTDNWLHFSVKLRGNAREKFFVTPIPTAWLASTSFTQSNGISFADATFQENPLPGSGSAFFRSAWAEVLYFLVPTGSTVNPSKTPRFDLISPTLPAGAGTPLFALYRCQYVVVPDPKDANAKKLSFTPQIAVSGDGVSQFYSPNDLADSVFIPNNPAKWKRAFHPYKHFPPIIDDIKNSKKPILPRGAALVLSNVLSFQVQVMKTPTVTGDFEDLGLPGNVPFDTANYVNGMAQPAPPPFSIAGLQIIIRIWDPRSRLTRQVTLIQDM